MVETDNFRCEINSAMGNKAEKSHTHDNRYYTESEMDTKLKAKAATSHTHNAIKMKSATSTISFDWVLVSGAWKLQVFVDGTLVRTL